MAVLDIERIEAARRFCTRRRAVTLPAQSTKPVAKRWIPKDPDEHVDYGLDWSARLRGDSILSSTWIVPDGLTADQDSDNGSLTIVWLSGGTVGKTYDIVNRVVTQNGRTFDQTVRLRISQLLAGDAAHEIAEAKLLAAAAGGAIVGAFAHDGGATTVIFFECQT